MSYRVMRDLISRSDIKTIRNVMTEPEPDHEMVVIPQEWVGRLRAAVGVVKG
jgi:hypothetical protein